MQRRNGTFHVSHYVSDAFKQAREAAMKREFEHQTEYDEPDEDEIIDPSSYEPTWVDRLLLIGAVIVAGVALLFMFTGGRLP